MSQMSWMLYEQALFYRAFSHSPEDDQSKMIETSSCQQPVLFRTNTTQKRFTHGATVNLTSLYSHHAKFQLGLTT